MLHWAPTVTGLPPISVHVVHCLSIYFAPLLSLRPPTFFLLPQGLSQNRPGSKFDTHNGI
jgi:hypothetical protein